MSKKLFLIIPFVLLTALGGPALAVSRFWTNGSGDGLWSTASNWSPSGVPVIGLDKAVINKLPGPLISNGMTAEAQLIALSDGAAGALQMTGGTLNVGAAPGDSWFIIAYGASDVGTFTLDGGAVTTSNRVFVGFQGQGTLDMNGGTFDIGGMFGIGYCDGGATTGQGYVYLKGGTITAAQFQMRYPTSVIGTLDITGGTLAINGDQTALIQNYVNKGWITAFGGAGRIVYEYNIANAGKTTVTAIDSVEGDIDKDFDVDINDLVLFVNDWLYQDCGSDADFDEVCGVDFRDFAILAANWMKGIVMNWHVVTTQYPTDDMIVTPHWADDFGIVADGTTDVSDAIQAALISVSNLGGGTLFLPAGNYKISGNLTIPSRVTLRGEWQKPQIGSPIQGTILQAYAGRGDENAAPFIGLSNCSGVKGLAIWYPEQLPGDIQPYPPTIQRVGGGNNTVENVTFVNSYFGFTTYQESITACPFLRNIYGTPLKTGIEYDCLADIGRIETVHFSPDFWRYSGLPNAPTANEHTSWIYNNGTGMIMRRIDWSYSAYVTIEGYNIGLALRPSRHDGFYPNGQSYKFTLQGCKTGVYVECSSYAGYQFTRFDIQQAETGVYLGTLANQADMFHTCSIDASGDAIFSEGTAKVLMMSSDIQQGTVRLNGGYLSVINSDFTSTITNHIELASGVHGASILGNSFTGGARISESTTYPVNIDHTPLTVDPMPAYDYKKPERDFKPAQPNVFVVTEYPYNAEADGATDDTAAFAAALTDAAAGGGGIVFVPGGNYRLNGTLVIPVGVELRGVFDVPHSTSARGSVLNIYAGRNQENGTPFIQIESGAGIRGLTFHYPEQIYDANDTVNYGMVPYPFMIRGLGSNVYVINVAATIPYQLLDLATYRCDNHYVDYILSTALKTGIHVGNGSVDGQIHNCQFNPSSYTHQGLYYDSIPFNTSDGIHAILWRDSTPYLFGNMSGEVLHENFVFGGLKGVHLVEEGGFGPSGHCMGMGVDQCTNAMQIDDIGSGGLDMINSQIVTVNGTDGRYLETGVSFDDTFRMFGSAGWGTHEFSAVINGGDVKLQLFHLARDGESGAFKVLNDASLQNLGGNLTDYLAAPRPFLTIDATATAEFIGNIINTSAAQMPVNSSNVVSIGNLRVQ